jgi:hypothetical protein
VERVGDAGGVVEPAGEPGPVGLGQIGGHHADALEPARRLDVEPSAQVTGAVALHHVDQDALVEIDQAGRIDRGVAPGGSQERGLIHPQGPDLANSVGVLDQRAAMLIDRRHDRPPAHPQLLGELGHRAGVATHLAACLHPRPPGQHGPRRDVR